MTNHPPPSAQVTRRTLLTALGLLAVGAGPVLAACSRGGSPSRSGAALRPIGGPDLARVAVELSAAPDLSAVVAGMDPFTAHLHAVAASTGTNFTVSPLSVAVAFGMLRAGERGETARQIDAVLGFAPSARPEGSPHEALNALTAALVTPPRLPGSSPAPAPVVAIANGLFVAKGFARPASARSWTCSPPSTGPTPTRWTSRPRPRRRRSTPGWPCRPMGGSPGASTSLTAAP